MGETLPGKGNEGTAGATGVLPGLLLLAAGDPWHAHEVWETAWKADNSPHRHAWKGLIQIAAAEWHRRRGNLPIAERQLARAAELLREGAHLGLDAAAVHSLLTRDYASVCARFTT